MKTFIKTSGMAIAMIAAFHAGFAQRTFDPEKMAQRQSDAIIQKVSSLSDQQKDSVKAITLEFAKARAASFQSGNNDRNAMRSAMQASRQAQDSRLKAVFTDDQYKQYQELEQSQRNRMRGGRGGGQRQGQNNQ